MLNELADWQQTYESGNTNTDLNMTGAAQCTLPTNSTRLAAGAAAVVSTNALQSATTALATS